MHAVSSPRTFMTYSLNTLNASAAKSPPRTGAARFGHEIALLVGLLALVFWLLALVSYSAQDAAWSTSGARDVRSVANWAGRFGAWLADGSYFALGFSVWWCVAAAVCAWFASLARWMRGGEVPEGAPSPAMRRLVFWVGLILLVCASAALEWSRLYRWDDALPGSAGGILGYLGGPIAVKWLGFTGSALLGIAVLVLGVALVFQFSWSQVAERIGGALMALVESRRERREIAQDLALGKQAAREGGAKVHLASGAIGGAIARALAPVTRARRVGEEWFTARPAPARQASRWRGLPPRVDRPHAAKTRTGNGRRSRPRSVPRR